MKRKFKTILIVVGLASLSSCQRACTSISRDIEAGNRNYTIEMYSGGKVVFTDTVTAMINNSRSSDGIYYYKGDTLVEISGDYILKSVD
jgi:hypothetical protein